MENQITEKMQVRAMAAPWNASIQFLLRKGDGVCRDLIFEKVEPGLQFDPTFQLDLDMAQTLIDDLWNAGLRPTEGSGSAGSLRATEKHLEDMRKLVFDSK